MNRDAIIAKLYEDLGERKEDPRFSGHDTRRLYLMGFRHAIEMLELYSLDVD